MFFMTYLCASSHHTTQRCSSHWFGHFFHNFFNTFGLLGWRGAAPAPVERLSTLLSGERPVIPEELKRRWRGCRAGVKQSSEKWKFKPYIPWQITWMNWKHLQEHRGNTGSPVFCVSWKRGYTSRYRTPMLPFPASRRFEPTETPPRPVSKKGGELAMLVNNRWCNPGHVSVKERVCSADIELVAVGLRPFYLPREFSSVIAITFTFLRPGKQKQRVMSYTLWLQHLWKMHTAPLPCHHWAGQITTLSGSHHRTSLWFSSIQSQWGQWGNGLLRPWKHCVGRWRPLTGMLCMSHTGRTLMALLTVSVSTLGSA